jgi:hypothetical protein
VEFGFTGVPPQDVFEYRQELLVDTGQCLLSLCRHEMGCSGYPREGPGALIPLRLDSYLQSIF